MAKENNNNKNKKANIIIYSLISFCIVIFSIWFGYVLDVTSSPKRGILWTDALNASDSYFNIVGFINAFVLLPSSKIEQEAALTGLTVGGFFLLLKLSGNKKKYRKGIEHGSARWGNQAEKDIICDKYDFYNNVICASDVFLVLDRKVREQNEAKHSKKKNTPKPLKKAKRNVDVEKLLDETKPEKSNALPVKDITKSKKANEKIKPMLNLNMMILGGSGTGKSRFYVKPNLMQCNTSFVVTDPSGELLQSCGKMLERKGYKIKVFNINDMRYSSNYNPFHYLKDMNGKVNENNVIKMINTFMLNTKAEGTSGGEQFWDDCTRLLLSAICFLLVEIGKEEEQNFSNVLTYIHMAEVKEEDDSFESDLDKVFEKRKEQNSKALSVQYYSEFKQAAGKTMKSILISTTTRLQHFKLEQIRNLTYTDNIYLETLGDEKTALFIIIPSTDTTYNFLAAMMYTQLFDILYDRAINKYHGRLPYHVRFVLDEFANVGKIPEFEKILATCRKFEISAQIILQNLSQLKRMYEKSWEELPGNCDTLIYLGGKDQFTNEYLSKELGKETIDTLNINKTKSSQGSTSYNDGIMGRELLTIDELSTMDNNDCIVMVRGLHPFKTAKFEIKNHPRYNMLDESNKECNTYYIEDNIHTEEEIETIVLNDNFDFSFDIDNTSSKIELVCTVGDENVQIPDIYANAPESAKELFDEIDGIFNL